MKVAVIIPCHNVREHVAAALDSALAQDHRDLDIVCVDDGSTDGSIALLQAYAHRYPDRIRVMTQAKCGASAARNAGLKASTGKYVEFLDADDKIDPNKISAQLALADRNGMPDLVIGDFEQRMPDGLLLPVLALRNEPWMALIKTRMGTTSANLWKRSALEAVGGWNADLASSQDYELMFRLLKNNGQVAWDQGIRTHVLKRASGSISQMGGKANWDRYINLRRDIKEHLEKLDPLLYAEEISTLRQYIFMALRIIAADDLPKAKAEYGRTMGKRFTPQVSRAITERYALLHNLLGFTTTERLLRLVKRIRH